MNSSRRSSVVSESDRGGYCRASARSRLCVDSAAPTKARGNGKCNEDNSSGFGRSFLPTVLQSKKCPVNCSARLFVPFLMDKIVARLRGLSSVLHPHMNFPLRAFVSTDSRPPSNQKTLPAERRAWNGMDGRGRRASHKLAAKQTKSIAGHSIRDTGRFLS